MTLHPDDLKRAFREAGRNIEAGLVNVAEAGSEDLRAEILSKLDDLIWRRQLLDKPHDQLDEIRSMVERL